jgi:hypothetical protein
LTLVWRLDFLSMKATRGNDLFAEPEVTLNHSGTK